MAERKYRRRQLTVRHLSRCCVLQQPKQLGAFPLKRAPDSSLHRWIPSPAEHLHDLARDPQVARCRAMLERASQPIQDGRRDRLRILLEELQAPPQRHARLLGH